MNAQSSLAIGCNKQINERIVSMRVLVSTLAAAPGVTCEVQLEDASLMHAPAKIISKVTMNDVGNAP